MVPKLKETVELLVNLGRSLVATALILMVISAIQYFTNQGLSNLTSTYTFFLLLGGVILVGVSRDSSS
ncbi:hypothetical protein HS1genome_1924 [Sulfodiicoccus acidiphilus]|uniref:Uncharacterized protein n=1 Tax=Sulfodiicoccus acidiphilus TaxID=1670455 RepID=A0A348B5T3_9CREN|nr:hypothetical protein [Sulfodiicoccus acidiphilus]BBD73535.1 hypothetical protein HS1genome_1924 [Sulfodiicoccus acidiphilus]GGT92472.1 hypothetical protein GCM10007116_07770 [Sulfodiicoccus acidiphilus]